MKVKNEEEYIISTFGKTLEKCSNEKIVLYGIGENTKKILIKFPSSLIIGLMDAEKTGLSIYGKRILTESEVIEKADKIIIVARKSVLNIIYQRIRWINIKHNIIICDIEGNLIEEKENTYANKKLNYWKTSKELLLNNLRL